MRRSDSFFEEFEIARQQVHSVRKRDGTVEPYRPDKIAAAIQNAARRHHLESLLLSDELAAAVTMSMARNGPRVPASSAIRTAVRRVLLELGFAQVAAEFDSPLPSPARFADPPPASFVVTSVRFESSEPWNRRRLISTLVLEHGLETAVAEQVAAAIEQRITALGFARVSGSLIEDLTELELLDRGLDPALEPVQHVRVPGSHINTQLLQHRGDRLHRELGHEVVKRHSLRYVLDPASAEAHLAGDLEIDGLHSPYQLRTMALNLAELPLLRGPGLGLTPLLQLIRGLAPICEGPVHILHLERALALLYESPSQSIELARSVLLALAGSLHSNKSVSPYVLMLGTGIPVGLKAEWFHQGLDPEQFANRCQAMTHALITESILIGDKLPIPRLRLFVGDPSMDYFEPSLRPAFCDALRDRSIELVESAGTPARLKLIGARVAVNAARLGLKAGRHGTAEFLERLAAASRLAVAAGTNRLRLLLRADESLQGPRCRVLTLLRQLARSVPLNLPGHHRYFCSVVPVGLETAVQAILERDPLASSNAMALKEQALATMRNSLPEDETGEVGLVVSEESWPGAAVRFGRLDFAAYPRGRDILRLGHDGEAYCYEPAARHSQLPALLDPSLDNVLLEPGLWIQRCGASRDTADIQGRDVVSLEYGPDCRSIENDIDS